MAKKTGPQEHLASAKGKLTVTVKAFGPSTEDLAAIGARIAAASLFRDFVGHAKARLLYVEALDEAVASKSGKPA